MPKLMFSFLAMLVLLAVSCKKDTDETDAVSVTGFWSGVAIDDLTSTGTPVSFTYRADGTVTGYAGSADTSMADHADGAYSIDTDSVRTAVTFLGTVTHFTSKLNGDRNQMTGTFRRETGTFRGSYSVTKQ
jgi:hypothetical protein